MSLSLLSCFPKLQININTENRSQTINTFFVNNSYIALSKHSHLHSQLTRLLKILRILQ